MDAVVADVLPMAVGIALSPFPIIPAILLLFTPRARLTSTGFLAGWVVGIAVATGAFAALAELVDSDDGPPAWLPWARLGLGTVLLVVGALQWRSRGREKAAPAWMRSIESATPAKAFRLGVLLSAANPKILLLAGAAGLAIGSADLSTADVVRSVALFTAIAASSVAVPVVLYAIVGDPLLGPLGSVKAWLQANNAAVMAVVITVIGVLLIAKGLDGL
jgi:threonine/homoserine/homoserine lactone efflux protein